MVAQNKAEIQSIETTTELPGNDHLANHIGFMFGMGGAFVVGWVTIMGILQLSSFYAAYWIMAMATAYLVYFAGMGALWAVQSAVND